MRLLYVADPFLPIPPQFYGGIERIVATTIQGALDLGHEVAFLAHRDSHLPGARLYPLCGGADVTQQETLLNILRVQKAVHDFRPDLVHSFARLACLVPILPSPLPKIMSFQREPTPRTVRWATRLAGDSLTFVGCSHSIAERGAAHGGTWQAIPNGIDLSRYRFQSHVGSNAPLVFLSRVERVKGAHHAIAAARAAGRKLILAGNHAATGLEAQYWKKEIEPHLGRNGILYVGPLDDEQKSELLGRACALIVPIEWEEPFGLVFIEALACGTPVLSHARGALPEIVEHGREGFLAHHPDELIAAISSIDAIDRAVCHAKVEQHFSADLMVERYDELYRRAATRRCSFKSTTSVPPRGREIFPA